MEKRLLTVASQLGDYLDTVRYDRRLNVGLILSGNLDGFTPIFDFMIYRFSTRLYQIYLDMGIAKAREPIELMRNIYALIGRFYDYIPCISLHAFLEEGNISAKIKFTLEFIRYSAKLHNKMIKPKEPECAQLQEECI
jgi:hypothetical protein